MYQGNYNKKPRSYSNNKGNGYTGQKMNYFMEIKNIKRKNYMADADRGWKHSLPRNFLFIVTFYLLTASLFYIYKNYIVAESGIREILYASLIPTGLFILCSFVILILRRIWISFVYNSRSRRNKAIHTEHSTEHEASDHQDNEEEENNKNS